MVSACQKMSVRAFEPFFTTKANVGTELGMSTAYATINLCGGHIEVESELDVGTTFRITLPVWEGGPPAENVAEAEVPPKTEDQLPGSILLVEDDDIITGVVAPALEKAGHTVAKAADGQEALGHLEDDIFDVAIVDLGLPRVSGGRVALRIKQTYPDTITVLITGWDLDPDDP